MDDLFLHQLQDIYYAEQKIEKSLPKMIDKAGSGALRQALESHLEETHNHVTRLEKVFSILGEDPKGVDCPAIDGIIEEAEDVAGEIADDQVLNAALAAAAQAVEHYEITRYGTLIAWAQQLRQSEIAGLLQDTLKEEKAADDKLTTLAEEQLNPAA